MGKAILIIGKSGSGKSSSMRNFKDLAIINVLGKELPFKDAQIPYITDDYNKIMRALLKTEKKSIVIDDAGYLMTNQFMRGHSTSGSGNAIFSFYNDLGDKFWNLIMFIKTQLPDDKLVYLTMHEEKNDFGDIKPKSIGKMLDEKVCIEGMFTIVLRSLFSCGNYVFKTKTDGTDVCKTPIGMFEQEEIDNDLALVDEAIRKYYGLNNESEDK